MVSRSIVVCVLGQFQSNVITKISLALQDVLAFHSNFSNQGVGLLTLKIKQSQRKVRRAK